MARKEIEELLELIWTTREEQTSAKKLILDLSNEKNPEELLVEMENDKLVHSENELIHLSPKGEKYAETIIRRHRLAERLFRDVFKLKEGSFEKEACTWEHVLSEEVTDSVCSFLGHPRVCPHNKPIPRGQCCFKYKHDKSLPPLVQPLTEIEVGIDVKIVYILPSLKKRLDRLTNLGVFPGSIIKIRQKQPALVVSCDETTIALDKSVGSEIFVLTVNGVKEI